MPVVVKRGATRFTLLQICDRFFGKQTAAFSFFDKNQFTVPTTSVPANTSLDVVIPIPLCALTDIFVTSPNFAMPIGLFVGDTRVTLASVGGTSPQTTLTPGAITVRFTNNTAGALAAAGVYNYLQVSQTAGIV